MWRTLVWATKTTEIGAFSLRLVEGPGGNRGAMKGKREARNCKSRSPKKMSRYEQLLSEARSQRNMLETDHNAVKSYIVSRMSRKQAIYPLYMTTRVLAHF